MSRPLIRRSGGRMGFRWRSEASFLAMNLSRSVSVKRIELYRHTRSATQPGASLPARAYPAAQDLDFELSQQTADGGARRDVPPREDVLSGDGRPAAARGPDPPGEGFGASASARGQEPQKQERLRR